MEDLTEQLTVEEAREKLEVNIKAMRAKIMVLCTRRKMLGFETNQHIIRVVCVRSSEYNAFCRTYQQTRSALQANNDDEGVRKLDDRKGMIEKEFQDAREIWVSVDCVHVLWISFCAFLIFLYFECS